MMVRPPADPAARDAPRVRFVAGRRRDPGRTLLTVVAVLLVAGGGLVAADAAFDGAPESGGPGPRGVTSAGADTAELPDAPDTADAREAGTTPFGTVADLVLHLPSTETVLVGYHEASRTGALAVTPVGLAVSNANTTRFDPPAPDADGADYHVMSSRGRALPPTSAVDLVLAEGDPVLAPVDGTVTRVRDELLYGEHDDTRVEIRPDAAPQLRVVLIHLSGVTVQRGDRVAAGRTRLARSANAFPFSSHVDRYLDERHPHVHLEVKDPRLVDDG